MTPVRRVERPDEVGPPLQPMVGGGEYAAIDPMQHDESPGMLRRVHGLLRGRYHWVLLLALIFGGAAGYYSYQSWEPLYASKGQIRIAPIVPRVLYSVEDNSMMPAYEGFIDSQMALMRSSRVVDLAMQSEEWRKLGRPLSDAEVAAFKSGLQVSRGDGSQVVKLTFTHGDPEVARVAVRSVIPAYMEIYGEEDLKREEARLNVLEQRRVALTNELKSLQDRIHAIANEFGSDSLEQVFQFKLKEVHQIQGKIRELNLKKAELEAAEARLVDNGDTKDSALNEWEPLDELEISRQDSVMRDYVRQLQALELDLTLARSFRRDAHPNVRALERQINALAANIEDYAFRYNQAALSEFANADGDRTKSEITRQKELIVSSVDRMSTTLAGIEEETRDVGRKDLQIKRLRDDALVAKQRLKETDTRLEMLNVERSLSVSGRVSVIGRGDKPTSPVNLDERTSQAALSSLGGCALAAGMVLIWGFMDRRHRYVEDADHLLSHAPLLGIVPELAVGRESSDRFDLAAIVINQMRALLQVGPVASGSKVFAVTSGSAGEGKTSVVAALGTSFAHAGKRTLMIDLDLVGRGLSRRWPARQTLDLRETIQRVAGLTQSQLDAAAKVSVNDGVAFDQACLGLELVDQPTLELAYSELADSRVGLEDALAAGKIENRVQRTGVDGLDVLSVSGSAGVIPRTLSPEPIRQLFEDAKSSYDIVLVDTGPVPGSLEASLSVSQVDEVLLVVAQGSDRRSGSQAISHLHRMNVSVSGVVYNRASQRCSQRHVSSQFSSSRSMSRPATSPEKIKPCPLVQASTGTIEGGTDSREKLAQQRLS